MSGDGALLTTASSLDFSFKELKSCAEIETEEPRGGGRRKPQQDKDGGGAAAAGREADLLAADITMASAGATGSGASGVAADIARNSAVPLVAQAASKGATQIRPLSSPHMKRVVRRCTVAVKLNNNNIETVQDLPMALDAVMDDPLRSCQWLDLSFNLLTSIEPAMLEFQQLKALYLHGNKIRSLPSVERLKKMGKLVSLTLNGNPIESYNSYRMYVIGALPQLRSLDHSTIIDDEAQSARSWFVAHQKRAVARKEKLEEARLIADGL
mmetsp:Transcript_51597/g.145429  ORF Transcript_51597/g.145429 Transcript_51597/m.145429 type:complete len:269 (+) Transcript_51597:113-919(+)|eukprot:CAMPEP_0179312722 /NCGR_PEP_ID=MMETSP0797-20121207/53426_1 /TAXON_ID=47934 /ORGANISM="Dinophysis acuminata, Strain DAEP01" /LENGTH=268 /DNA_ID=CAMNT_0021022691 /DNA_START=45 /DNA_END=851 /DNA_ORIENTATION=-